jgi:exodeoxyribonuclease III
MKIITWNINGYRSITGQNASKRYDVVTKDNRLFKYIEDEKPDIICLQEVKADQDQISPELIAPSGYEYFYNTATSKKGYSGVAVFSKMKPKSVETKINIDKFDAEGRILKLDFDDFIVYNIYFPKGYADNDRLDYKMEFYDVMKNNFSELIKSGRKIIISGDYNTAHKEIDLARPKENVGTSGFMPIERVKLDEYELIGLMDAFRVVCKDGGHYSWWSQRGQARRNNIGWRIDYHYVSNNLEHHIKDCYMQPNTEGSDHCPVVLELDL